jgi:hypothetical protein
MGMTVLNPASHPDWRKAQRFAGDCEAGRCRYGDGPSKPERKWVDSTTHCDGYAGFAHLEGEGDQRKEIVMRWRMCDRQLAWWAVEKLRLRALKAKAREAEKRAKAGFTGETAKGSWRDE